MTNSLASLTSSLNQWLINNNETAEHSTLASSLLLPSMIAGLIKNIHQPSYLTQLMDWLADMPTELSTDEAIQWGKRKLPILLNGCAAEVVAEIAQQSHISKTNAGTALALALTHTLQALNAHAPDQKALLTYLAAQLPWLTKQLNPALLAALGIGNLAHTHSRLATAVRLI